MMLCDCSVLISLHESRVCPCVAIKMLISLQYSSNPSERMCVSWNSKSRAAPGEWTSQEPRVAPPGAVASPAGPSPTWA